jgi:hypothetical protein
LYVNLQHVLPDWDEYLTDSDGGRKFYFNRLTREKSWKPPRRPKQDENSSNNENNTSDSDLDAASPPAKNSGGKAVGDRLEEKKKPEEGDIEVEVRGELRVKTTWCIFCRN